MASNNRTERICSSWGEIVLQLKDGKPIQCSLPHLDQKPAVAFRIGENGKNDLLQFICDVFCGRSPTRPALGELNGSLFQKRVWQAIMRIPAGKTKTYGQIAAELGNPRAYRAVANACGKNPLPLFIPCHRVIGSDGKLHGFSAGTAWKRLLLRMEGHAGF